MAKFGAHYGAAGKVQNNCTTDKRKAEVFKLIAGMFKKTMLFKIKQYC